MVRHLPYHLSRPCVGNPFQVISCLGCGRGKDLKKDLLCRRDSTLSGLLIYLMSLFVIPRRVSSRLEKIQRDLERKLHLMNWSIVGVD